MITSGNHNMGRFSVEVELANAVDLVQAESGQVSPDQVRRLRTFGIVASRTLRVVIPQETADCLGLLREGTTAVRYPDGRREQRDLVGGLRLACSGRSGEFDAIVDPDRHDVLIGSIVLTALDLRPDEKRQTLTPRDPKLIISEIE